MADPDLHLDQQGNRRLKRPFVPQVRRPVTVSDTVYNEKLRPRVESVSWNGHVLPKVPNSTDKNPLVGIKGKDSYYYDPSNPYVDEYGARSNMVPMTDAEGNPVGSFSHNTWSQLDAMSQWGEEQLANLQVQLVKAGWVTKQSLTGSWNDSTEKAVKALMLIGNRSGITWEEAMMNGTDITGNTGTNGTGDGPPQDYTDTRTEINKTPRRDALTILREAMKEDLGRAPTDEEMRGFVKDLHEFERGNPDVTTTQHRFKKEGDGYVDNPVVENAPGADPSFLYDQYAEESPDTKKEARKYRRTNLLWNLVSGIESGEL